MRWFCSWTLTSYLVLLGVAFQSVPSAEHPANEDLHLQTIPEWQLQKLTLLKLGETYQTIPLSKTAEGRAQLEFTLKVRIRLENISRNHILALDPSCFRLVRRVVFPEPLVGPVEAPNDVFASGNRFVDACKNLGAPRKIVRVMPGKSYETTEQLKFKVLDDSPADLSESLNPGVYYLQVTIVSARNWDIDKQTIVGFVVGPIESTLLKFAVRGKPRQI